MISSKDVQKLRELTSAGIMDCKKALEEANEDFQKAKDILKKKGALKAIKKSGRSANQGTITCYVHAGGKIGVMLELSCETDFAAKNTLFTDLAHNISMQIVSMNPTDEKELLGQEFIKDPSMTIKELIEENVGKIGENIRIKRFIRYQLGE